MLTKHGFTFPLTFTVLNDKDNDCDGDDGDDDDDNDDRPR